MVGLIILISCDNPQSTTEPILVIPTPIPVVIPVTLFGQFVEDGYGSGNIDVAVTLNQGNKSFKTTSDVMGSFKLDEGLEIGIASIKGVAKSGCCSTELPIVLTKGVNNIVISVIFI